MAYGNMTQQQVAYGYANNDAELQERRRQQQMYEQEMERRRQDQLAYDRQRQSFQEGILQQEQSRRGRETDKRGANEELGINKTFELGKYGEDTKRRGQNVEMGKARMGNATAKYGFDKMATMFGDNPGTSVDLFDNSGERIGGTNAGGGAMRPMGSGGYKPQKFTLRDSLLG
jgi:hypothetical protein